MPKPVVQRADLGSEDPEQALLDHRPVVLTGGKIHKTPFYVGESLQPGNKLNGPAIVVYLDTTAYLEVGDHAWVDEGFNLVVEVEHDA